MLEAQEIVTDFAELDGFSDAWTEEDIQDLRRFSGHRFVSESAAPEAEQDDPLPPPEDLPAA